MQLSSFPDDHDVSNTVPCIVLLHYPNGDGVYHGPFNNVHEARKWIDDLHDNTSRHMSMSIIHLRRTDLQMRTGDYYAPSSCFSEEDYLNLYIRNEMEK